MQSALQPTSVPGPSFHPVFAFSDLMSLSLLLMGVVAAVLCALGFPHMHLDDG